MTGTPASATAVAMAAMMPANAPSPHPLAPKGPGPSAFSTITQADTGGRSAAGGALPLGGRLPAPGGASELLPHLSRYGLPLGDAFQMRDDVMGVDYGVVSAVGVFYLVPSLLLYVFAQRYLMQMSIGGVKG